MYKKTGKDHFNYRHGLCGTLLYKKWEAMKRRCLNKNEKCYSRYGGRGIKICDKWLDFTGFYKDMGKSFIEGMSLERIDNSKGYFKENCKWIPVELQAKNKRSVVLYEFRGKKLCIPDWEKLLGFKEDTLRNRIKKLGWSVEEAITAPVHYGNRYNQRP